MCKVIRCYSSRMWGPFHQGRNLITQWSLTEPVLHTKESRCKQSTVFSVRTPATLFFFSVGTLFRIFLSSEQPIAEQGYNTRCFQLQIINTQNKVCYFFPPVVTPTTTLLTNFPLSSTVIGFSTTTVTFCDWVDGAEVDGTLYEVPFGAGIVCGNGLMVFIPIFVMKLQIAHLTEDAPYGYINTVWHWPQLTWAILLTGGAGLARLTVSQHEHLTVVALRVYINKVRHPTHISWAISIPGGGALVTAWQTAQHTLGAPLG